MYGGEVGGGNDESRSLDITLIRSCCSVTDIRFQRVSKKQTGLMYINFSFFSRNGLRLRVAFWPTKTIESGTRVKRTLFTRRRAIIISVCVRLNSSERARVGVPSAGATALR